MPEFESQILLPPGVSQEGTLDVVRSLVETSSGKFEFAITLGDLTQTDADAIVCPANPGFEPAYMLGGVQAAIARRAGLATFEEAERKAKQYIASGGTVDRSRGYAGLPLGFALSTTPGNLDRIKYIIHVNNLRTEENLPPCDEEVVRLAASGVMAEANTKADIQSVAFPAIGTGLWGMKLGDSLRGTVLGIKDHFEMTPQSHIRKASFVVYAAATYQNALEMHSILAQEVFPNIR